MTEELGHVPAPGEAVEIEGVAFQVESVVSHAVAWVVATPRRSEREREREAEEERDG